MVGVGVPLFVMSERVEQELVFIQEIVLVDVGERKTFLNQSFLSISYVRICRVVQIEYFIVIEQPVIVLISGSKCRSDMVVMVVM
jgi:hypothetical protein